MTDDDKASDHVRDWIDFLKRSCKRQLAEIGREFPHKRSLFIDLRDLEKFGPVGIKLWDEVTSNPDKAIEDVNDAIITGLLIKLADGKTPKVREVNIRFTGLSKKTTLRELRYEDVNTLVAIDSIVIRSSEVRPRISNAAFRCPAGHYTYRSQRYGKFNEPDHCETEGCQYRRLELMPKRSKFVNQQRVKIQESGEGLRPGQQPQTMDVVILDDLCDQIYPPDRATMNGILRSVQRVVKGEKSTIFDLYLELLSIEAEERNFSEIPVTAEAEEQIREIAKSGKALEMLAASIATSIYGYQDIKRGIALQMFGGVTSFNADGTRNRGEIHIMILGDPGCVIPGTLVSVGDGTQKRIENITLNDSVQIGHITDKIKISDKFQFEDKPLIRIVTQLGREVTVTPEHPLLTRRGWIQASKLIVGQEIRAITETCCSKNDYVPLDIDTTIFPQGKHITIPEFLTEELGWLYGMFIGDGWITKNKYRCAITVSEDEKELIPKITELTTRLFNITPTIEERSPDNRRNCNFEGRVIRRTKTIYQLVWNSKLLARIFDMENQPTRIIPDNILASSNSVVAAFLNGLFTADGCIIIDYKKDHKISRYRIGLKSSSHRLLLDVQVLLLRWGINARIAGDSLLIGRYYDVMAFIENIGFSVTHKIQKTKDAIKDPGLVRYPPTQKEYLKITKIEPIGNGPVYDITVPNVHRYVSDGIISHNTAKTKMIKYAANQSPRGISVSAITSSGPGLTGTATRDEDGRWTIEAGALPLADGGIAAVDEIDKAEDSTIDHLLSVAEDGEVRVVKAGQNRVLKARDSLICAGNPKEERFDLYADLIDQINIPPAFLSRFDLLYLMIDSPDPKLDEERSRHVIKNRYIAECRAAGKPDRIAAEDLKTIDPPIPPLLLKQYVAYAKRTIVPIMNPQVREFLTQHYLKLRGPIVHDPKKAAPSPATMRQQEALVRLSEASARIRLSAEVTLKDAETATTLFEACMKAVATDPKTGQTDFGRIGQGLSQEKINMIGALREIIRNEPGIGLNTIYSKMDERSFKNQEAIKAAIDRMLNARPSDLLESKHEHYRVI